MFYEPNPYVLLMSLFCCYVCFGVITTGLVLGSDDDLTVVVREGGAVMETDGEEQGDGEGEGEGDLDRALDSYESTFTPDNGGVGGGADGQGLSQPLGGAGGGGGGGSGPTTDNDYEPFSEGAYLAALALDGRGDNARGGRGSVMWGSRRWGILTSAIIPTHTHPTTTTTTTTTSGDDSKGKGKGKGSVSGVKRGALALFATPYSNSRGDVTAHGLAFHLSTVNNYNKPGKTLADSAPVSDLMSSYNQDLLVLQQLALDCPIKVTNHPQEPPEPPSSPLLIHH